MRSFAPSRDHANTRQLIAVQTQPLTLSIGRAKTALGSCLPAISFRNNWKKNKIYRVPLTFQLRRVLTLTDTCRLSFLETYHFYCPVASILASGGEKTDLDMCKRKSLCLLCLATTCLGVTTGVTRREGGNS